MNKVPYKEYGNQSISQPNVLMTLTINEQEYADRCSVMNCSTMGTDKLTEDKIIVNEVLT